MPNSVAAKAANPPVDKSAGVSKRLPGLDGLRAVAVCLVLLSHFYHGDAHGNPLERLSIQGAFGVTIFFVLSGYLITHLLLREEESQGTISIPLFYSRRALRILPPLLFYLFVLLVADFAGYVHVPTIDFVASLFFVRNLVGQSIESAHLWSLAIEEQFYLFWPLILILLRNSRLRIAFCSAIVLFSPIWRFLVIRSAGFSVHLSAHRTDLNLDPLVLGALLALLLSVPKARRILTHDWVRGGWVAIAAILALGAFQLTDLLDVKVIRAFRLTASIFCVATVINCVIHHPKTRLAKFMDLGILAWIGRLSYSLYLWQQPFASGINPVHTWFREFPVSLIFAVGFATFSYYFVEKPFFELRRRFQHKAKKSISVSPVNPAPSDVVIEAL
jgi:peptidoglycan/LPS O-acetylase OafA/YrhL